MDDAVLLPQRNGHLGALRRCHADPVGVRAHLRQKGGKHEVVATYDAEFRAGFERQITGWATDFMRRSHQQGKPFYLYLPYTQTHIPTIPDPEYVGRTKRGNWADILTQMDDFTGQILDELHTLGLGEDTIVVWASDNGGDSTYRMPAGDRTRSAGHGTDSGARGGARCYFARGLEPDAMHHPLAGESAGQQGHQRTGARGRLVPHSGAGWRRERARRPGDRRDGHARLPARGR